MKLGDTIIVRETSSKELIEKFSDKSGPMKWIVVEMITDIAGYYCDPVVSVIPVGMPKTVRRSHFFVREMTVYPKK